MSITINTSTGIVSATNPITNLAISSEAAITITAKATKSSVIPATATHPTKLNIEVTLNSRSLR